MDRAPEIAIRPSGPAAPPSAPLPFAAGCLTFAPRWEDCPASFQTGHRPSGQPRITHLHKRSDLARLLRMAEQESGRALNEAKASRASR